MKSDLNIRTLNPFQKEAARTFFHYVFNNENYFENYKKLVNNLSQEQKKFIDLTIARALHLYSTQYELTCDFTPEELCGQLDITKNFENKIIKKEGFFQYKHYKLPTKLFESSIFYYKMGLENIKNREMLAGTDFIDAGAHYGDSFLILNEVLNPGKVHCFEPVQKCFNSLLKTIEMNDLKEKAVPIKQGLGDKQEAMEICVSGAASSLISSKVNQTTGKELIEITTIDNYVEKNNLNIGLIKIDVEGFDMEVLRGAEKTVKQFKPVVIGSIYHNAPQFFEFKPLLESWNLGYKFHFEKLNPNRFLNEINVLCEVY